MSTHKNHAGFSFDKGEWGLNVCQLRLDISGICSCMAKRELISIGTDKRYVRRDSKGQFKESDDVGRSLAADRRTKAKTKAKFGQGDKGDHRAVKSRKRK